MPTTLKRGGRIGIIGAGPAGSFFAIHLLRKSKLNKIYFDINLFDRKFFTESGPRGCNMCAGAIGANLIERLKDIGIYLPKRVIRDEVNGYIIHGRGDFSYIRTNPSMKIYTVFRGAGPHQIKDKNIEGLDHYLLNYATNLGAKFHNFTVDKIIFEDNCIKLIHESKDDEFDLVVGAFGVNTVISDKIEYGYSPPKTWHSCQAELNVSPKYFKSKFSKMIHIFLSNNPSIEFSAITPKGDCLTFTSIGKHVKIDDVKYEINNNREINNLLSDGYEIICHCHPRLPATSAKNPFRDRFVTIGDAFISRYLKNGIESSFYTANFAVETILNSGISLKDFKKFYNPPCIKMFEFDNLCGRLLFKIYGYSSKNTIISKAYISEVKREQKNNKQKSRIASDILWNLFTGDLSYKKIFIKFFNPIFLFRLFLKMIKISVKEGFKRGIRA
jgi:flavin-dependent dehydrogenase